MSEESDNPNNQKKENSKNLITELNKLLGRLGSPKVETVTGVFGSWEDVVGSHVAQHVSPLKLVRGRLVVEVDDPAWATHTKFLEHDICTSLSRQTGATITGLEIRVKSGRQRG